MKFALDIGMLFNGLLVIVVGYAGWQFRKLISSVSQLEKDIEVLKVHVANALDIKDDVKTNGERLIRLDERMDKCTKDLNVLHEAKRDIYQKIS